jgi:ribonuclease III
VREPALDDLQSALGVTLADPSLLVLALSHRSYAFEAGGIPTNERLEFLGDAVLGVIVTDWIYHRFPDAAEGRLAKLRAAAVNASSLAAVARRLDIGAHVLLGRGEEQSGGRDKDSILADTFEAVVGAIYLDAGMAVARAFVEGLFADLLDDLALRRESLDYKTSLQELTAAELSQLPSYQVTDAGPDHEKWFTAEVTVDGEVLGSGEGRSKKEAEQMAAAIAYRALVDRLQPAADGLITQGDLTAEAATNAVVSDTGTP